MQAPVLLNIEDLSRLLGVTRQTVHNMLNSGRFPVEPVPGMKPRRWNADAVSVWLNSSERAAG